MDAKFTSLYKNVSIVIPILYSPCLIVNEIIEMTGVGLYFRGLILLNLFLIAAFSFKRAQFTKYQKIVLSTIIISLLYFIILGITIYQGSNYTVKTPIKNYMTAILIFVIINDIKFNLNRFIRMFIAISFLFSLTSVLQLALYYVGSFTPNPYYLKTYDVGRYTGIGFGGFISGDYFIGNIYRIESFWREPSRFAQFLQASIFLSLHQYISKKKIATLFVLLTLIIAFILTFSVANYFAVLFGLTLFFLIARKDIIIKMKTIRIILTPILIIVLVSGFISFYKYTESSIDETGNFLSKKTVQQLDERLKRINYATTVLQDSYFGNPNIRNNWSRNPSALGMMIVWAGIPGVILAIMLSIVFFRSIIKQVRKSKYSIIYIGSITFFIAFNWYGSYFENYFLFLIALYLVIIKYDDQNVNIFYKLT
jgi:hypothetical protein